MWGKPVRESEFLFLQFLKLHISKNKTNSMYLSHPLISVLEIYRKKPNTATLEICAQTAVPYGLSQHLMLYDLSRKSCPEIVAAVRRSYGLYGPLNAAFCLEKRVVVRPEQNQ